jgi:hypothetical protein
MSMRKLIIKFDAIYYIHIQLNIWAYSNREFDTHLYTLFIIIKSHHIGNILYLS